MSLFLFPTELGCRKLEVSWIYSLLIFRVCQHWVTAQIACLGSICYLIKAVPSSLPSGPIWIGLNLGRELFCTLVSNAAAKTTYSSNCFYISDKEEELMQPTPTPPSEKTEKRAEGAWTTPSTGGPSQTKIEEKPTPAPEKTEKRAEGAWTTPSTGGPPKQK